MNNTIIKIIQENHLHPIEYIKKGNVYIIKDKEKQYVLKLNTNNYDIYQYLTSRDFLDFPENFNKKNDYYDLSEYIEEIAINNEQKINDLLMELSLLHKKTSYKRTCDIDCLKKEYEDIKDYLMKSKEYYYQLNDMIDKELFFSPSEYLLVRNISLIYYLIGYVEKNLDEWYQKISKEKSMRVSLLHNNVDINHLIINNHKYLINWDKSYFGNPINDLVAFYKKYYNNLNLRDVLKIYERNNSLDEMERELLLIKLALPDKIIFTNNTYQDTILINQEMNFWSKIYDYLKK